MNADKKMIKELTSAVLNEDAVNDYAEIKDLGKTEDKILKERLACYIKYLQDEIYPSLFKKTFGKQAV